MCSLLFLTHADARAGVYIRSAGDDELVRGSDPFVAMPVFGGYAWPCAS